MNQTSLIPNALSRRSFLKTSAAALLVCATALTCPSALPKAKAAGLERTYLICASSVEAYEDKTLKRKPGQKNAYGVIYSSDELYILNRDPNGKWVKVSYEVTGTGNRKIGYISADKIFTKTNNQGYHSSKQITTYTRPNGSRYGYISAGDPVVKYSSIGGYTQVKYPARDDIKYAFIKNADLKWLY